MDDEYKTQYKQLQQKLFTVTSFKYTKHKRNI